MSITSITIENGGGRSRKWQPLFPFIGKGRMHISHLVPSKTTHRPVDPRLRPLWWRHSGRPTDRTTRYSKGKRRGKSIEWTDKRSLLLSSVTQSRMLYTHNVTTTGHWFSSVALVCVKSETTGLEPDNGFTCLLIEIIWKVDTSSYLKLSRPSSYFSIFIFILKKKSSF